MPANSEVIFSTELTGQLWNICAWDLHNGTTLATYKGTTTGPKTLALLGNEYIIGAPNNKPLVHVWSLNTKDQYQMRIVCPGKVSALAVSPDNCYCICAILEKIHIWQVKSGNLLAVVSQHYQAVTCIRITDDGCYFLSGGDDNLVMVWRLGSVLSNDNERIEPLYTWSSHSLPITDIHCGCGGIRSRVVTSSLDQTCKLWDLSSGMLLASFLFEASITSVKMDIAEHFIFAGGINGSIWQINLFEKAGNKYAETVKETFSGHSKKVTCLDTSFDDSLLISGSDDATLKIWHIGSRQCIRTLKHKGALTNVMVVPAPGCLLKPGYKPVNVIQPFKRNIHISDGENSEDIFMSIQSGDVPEKDNIDIDKLCRDEWKIADDVDDDEEDSAETVAENLQKEVSMLKNVNQQLYEFSVENILKGK